MAKSRGRRSVFSTPCSVVGCSNLTHDRFCDDHKHLADVHRASASRRGYDASWRRYRKVFLSQHYLCEECKKNGRVTLATVVDHIQPHKGDKRLFWDEGNHQALCESCHNRKTAQEDGGGWNTWEGLR